MKFKVGDYVRITKPSLENKDNKLVEDFGITTNNVKGQQTWVFGGMDHFDDLVEEILRVEGQFYRLHAIPWRFHEDWLTLVTTEG